MALFGRYCIINKPTEKLVKRMRKKLAKQCVRDVKKIIHANMDSFFIEKEAGEFEELLGRRKGSMSIGWKIDLPTIKDDC
jgi:hypothetical protein